MQNIHHDWIVEENGELKIENMSKEIRNIFYSTLLEIIKDYYGEDKDKSNI